MPETFIGVDGCKAGWFAAILKTKDGEPPSLSTKVFKTISELWEEYRNASLILIDIPIGLNERETDRRCDKEARKILGRRGASVFPPPCRKALLYTKKDQYKKACNENKKMTEKRLSKQTFYIIPKIREVDGFLLNDESAQERFKETHPEICFWALNNKKAMKHPKKAKEGKGFEERRRVLERALDKETFTLTIETIENALKNYRRKEVGKDDIMDAVVAAVTALGGGKGLKFIPEKPEKDFKGLKMAIAFRVPS